MPKRSRQSTLDEPASSLREFAMSYSGTCAGQCQSRLRERAGRQRRVRASWTISLRVVCARKLFSLVLRCRKDGKAGAPKDDRAQIYLTGDARSETSWFPATKSRRLRQEADLLTARQAEVGPTSQSRSERFHLLRSFLSSSVTLGPT